LLGSKSVFTVLLPTVRVMARRGSDIGYECLFDGFAGSDVEERGLIVRDGEVLDGA
jgi:hypothetical protein